MDLIKENPQYSYSQMEKHYAHQIVTNSVITHRKLKHFKIALFFTISAVTSILGGVFLYLLFNPKTSSTIHTQLRGVHARNAHLESLLKKSAVSNQIQI